MRPLPTAAPDHAAPGARTPDTVASDRGAPGPAASRKAAAQARRASLLYLPALVFLICFFLLPLLGNVWRSLSVGQEAAAQAHPVLGLAYYVKLLSDAYYLGIIFETLKVSMITTALCAVIGYPVAYFLTRRAGRFGPVLLFLLVAPLLTSIIMRTFGWRVLFARRGLINGWLLDLHLIDHPLNVLNSPVSVYMGLVHVMVPFMVLSISPVLQGVDRRLEESARILGAGAVRTFLGVTLPLSMEGVITGCILVFMICNGSFVTMLLLGGGQVVTLPVLIFQQFSLTRDIGFAAAMGNVLLVVVLLCLYAQQRLGSRKAGAA